MENFELIDQYLSGKLEGIEKEAFEQKLSSDPAFKSEVTLQSQIVSGIKSARASELKAMLNKVPVAATPFFESSVLKIAATILGGGALVAALYFYNSNNINEIGPKMSTSLEDSVQGKALIDSGAREDNQSVITNDVAPLPEKNTTDIAKPKEQLKTEQKVADKPKIEVIDPSEDVTSQEVARMESNTATPSISVARIEIETIQNDKKHSFHYQFEKGKLVLYGAFDKGLYEVIEINSETRSLFLYYKSNYHLLDQHQENITPLEAISDATLIRKLNQFRGQ